MNQKFISFEGIDGSGKSTQIRLLTQRLDENGIPYLLIREPGGTAISEKIREILLNRGNSELSQRSESLLFMAARAQVCEEKIRPALLAGKVVIADRFTDSSLAYQGGGRALGVEKIHLLNQYATNGLFPDISFLLDISVETASKRRAKENADRMEASGDAFLQKTRKVYLNIAKKEPGRFHVIPAETDIRSIQEQIFAIINSNFAFNL